MLKLVAKVMRGGQPNTRPNSMIFKISHFSSNEPVAENHRNLA